MQYAPETILADWTFVFYLKVFGGGALKGAVFWWFGNCFLVTFEEYQPSWKSRGPHGKLFWDYFSLANCELVFHVSFSNYYYWKLRYRWHWVIGFHFILIFSHPSLFLSVLPLPPHLQLCPSHSLQTPPPSSPFPSVHPSSPRSSVDCRGRHWTVNLTPGWIMTRGRKLISLTTTGGLQKGQKLQRARWPVPFRPFTLKNLTKKKFWPTLPGGGRAPPSPPLNPPLNYSQRAWYLYLLDHTKIVSGAPK